MNNVPPPLFPDYLHLTTEETSTLTLSLLLSQTHVLSRNLSLLSLFDAENYSVRDKNSVVIQPGEDCIKGLAVVTVKGQGRGVTVADIEAAVTGITAVTMKLETPASPASPVSPQIITNTTTTTTTTTTTSSSSPPLRKHYTSLDHSSITLQVTASMLSSPTPLSYATHSFPFTLALPTTTSPTFTYPRAGAELLHNLSLTLTLPNTAPPLMPTRGGKAVVKFRIVKKGGARVRVSSRRNAKEIGWIPNNSIVCVDQKEWYDANGPDPLRKSVDGFWRVHVTDSDVRGGVRGGVRGWITGKSDVIDPIAPGTTVSVRYPIVVSSGKLPVNVEVGEGVPQFMAPKGFGLVPREVMATSRVASDGCCFGGIGGSGHVKIVLGLDRTCFWKRDEGKVGGGKRENNSQSSRLSFGETGGEGLKVRRPSISEMHAKAPTMVIRGFIRICNSSKDEIPQAKVNVVRTEVIKVVGGGKAHSRTNYVRVRSVKWGPILPHSVFTRRLEINVNMVNQPPSMNCETVKFSYSVCLEADLPVYQKNPSAKVEFVLMEGTTPQGMGEESKKEGGGGGERGGGEGGGGYGKMKEDD